jgi:hypothetical protein
MRISRRSWGSVTTSAGVDGSSHRRRPSGTECDVTARILGAVLRLVLSPRWVVWHVLTLGAMITCGYLAAWQWERAGSAMGSAVNIGYGIQWPIFAIFFGAMWWRFLRLEVRALREAEEPAVDARRDGVHAARPAVPETADGAIARGAGAAAARDDGPPEPSPFRRSPLSSPPVADAEDPELAEYNRMLAALAWRNSDGA